MVNPKQLIHEAKKHLYEWHDLKDVIKFSDDSMNKLDNFPGQVSLHRPGLDFLREAYCGALFAGIVQQSFSKKYYIRFRINKNDPPDFQIQTSKFEEENWELVECQLPCRKRGEKYKFPRNETELDYPSAIIRMKVIDANIDHLEKFLNPTAIKKVNKKYPPDTKLLCYLNIDTGFSKPREFYEKLQCGMELAKNAFSEIWIIDQDMAVFPLWENGNSHPEFNSCFRPKGEIIKLLYRLEND